MTAYNVSVVRDGRLVACLVAVWLHPACGNPRAESTAVPETSAPVADVGASPLPHGNHDPKYGGVVLMNGDLHFEVVLRRDGRHQVYFSDAARSELPASIASSVSIAVSQNGRKPAVVGLEIDDAGESWVIAGRAATAVTDPEATARISYTIRGKEYWMDLPFSAVPVPPGAGAVAPVRARVP
jgi:hypothetical protein